MRDTIVIGGSAGAVEAIQGLVAQLPAELPAAVLVAVHLSPGAVSVLPDIVARRTKLRVVPPARDEPLVNGRIYVVRPDRHLVSAGCAGRA